jgi:threonine/homoserine/homoserine lactone efflux protein
MFLLFGKSMNPIVRLVIGAVALAVGIVFHMAILELGGGAYLAFAAFMLVRNLKRNAQ